MPELIVKVDDASLLPDLKRAIKLLRGVSSITIKKEKPAVSQASSIVSEEAEPYHRLTREEQIAEVNEMCEEIKLIRAGKLKGQTWEDFKHELHG